MINLRNLHRKRIIGRDIFPLANQDVFQFLCAGVPVCVLPTASCQREAFCLFQYITMNLSLGGIGGDETESSFLNGSKTVHIVSLWGINVLKCESTISWRCFQIIDLSACFSGKFFYQTEAESFFCARTKTLDIPQRWQVEERTFFWQVESIISSTSSQREPSLLFLISAYSSERKK